MGPNFPVDMTWERLLLLSLSKKRPKQHFLDKEVPPNNDFAFAPWLQQHSDFFGTCSVKLYNLKAP